jgi:MOSC domain-containing protein YiiM
LEKIRAGLPAEIAGKRGMLCKVLRGGVIRLGDKIKIAAPFKTSAKKMKA